jgi:vacuolar protein sorting-associated protein 35
VSDPLRCNGLFSRLIQPLQVTTKYLNGLIELIHSNLAGNQQDSASVEASRKHFMQTLDMIRSKEYEGIVLTPK